MLLVGFYGKKQVNPTDCTHSPRFHSLICANLSNRWGILAGNYFDPLPDPFTLTFTNSINHSA